MAASCLPDALWKRKCGNENMEPAVTNPELSGRMVSDHGSAEHTPPPGAPHPLVEPYHNATPAVEDGPPPVVSEPAQSTLLITLSLDIPDVNMYLRIDSALSHYF